VIFLVKKNIKRAIANLKSSLPLRTDPSGVRILMYHSIGGKPGDHPLAIRVRLDHFKEHTEELLRLKYRSYTVSEFAADKEAACGKKGIVITFDDGYKDNLTAAAILKASGLKATFFVTVSYINGQAQKKWADDSRREFMSWQDVRRLSEMGFEVGSHMIRHMGLSTLAKEDLRLELSGSKDVISGYTGKAVNTLSYPYGYFNDTVVACAREIGYRFACSSQEGWNGASLDRYILKRTEIDGYDTINDFRLKIKGYYDRI
jgi:peptidoglycan/xylan/chitin deacetylase (PgdA/CDA1 family)